VQIALVHLLFNIIGILLFYPVPVMRWPVGMAQVLGDTTAKYRWFSLVYLVGMFFVFPGIIFLLSLAGPIVMYAVFVPLAVLLVFIIVINLVQRRQPKALPPFLRTWTWVPEPLRSLEPADRVVVACLGWWRRKRQGPLRREGEGAVDNQGFQTNVQDIL
jgi:sodium-dependent phosphate cotransporter